jgi:hypothetical protein
VLRTTICPADQQVAKCLDRLQPRNATDSSGADVRWITD